ncbi:MAG: HD domain-containing protein [Candidatus Woesearchaeota archaeon]|jgi:putative nucleotidyltransferase with HDIG domain|nr:HD domain-containing protein [Candidatus Woesearchaeota archaeon]MDP7506309.1 HD domain-containing protein [Candidatus Woesearchaeota archaeon]MDP7610307.1 HD domain-containing protein [Candidatus Woesearchaeota archaeon]|tara:strand:+ start:1421 stop:1984 length:564 start_codon:yes stop_codon:yes gene_type:complete
MKLDEQLEERLKSEAIKYLEQGKPDWDIPHTLATVHWMRQLIEKEGGDERTLVTTMYLHDVGYPELKKGYDFDDLMKSKKHHAQNGAEIAEEILTNLEYSPTEVKTIIKLVGDHYNKENINTHDLQLVIEADGLAKIDWERVTPNFDKENCLKYLDYFKGRTAPQFRTNTGKRSLKELLQKAENYWK